MKKIKSKAGYIALKATSKDMKKFASAYTSIFIYIIIN